MLAPNSHFLPCTYLVFTLNLTERDLKRFVEEAIMRNEIRALCIVFLLITNLGVAGSELAAAPQNKNQRSEEKYRARLVKEVRHQLVMLPWYSVFDNLAYQVDGDKVI